MKMNWLLIMCLFMTVRFVEAGESKSIQIPNQKYALYDIPPAGNDLVLNIVKGQGVNKILNDSIRLQDGSDNTQWTKDQAASQTADHPVYNIFGVNCGKECVCVTGVYSTVGTNGGSGSSELPHFDVDVLKMDLIVYVDQPGNGNAVPFVITSTFPFYDIGHAWYKLKITDVENNPIANQQLALLIASSLFGVMNKPVGWYSKTPLDWTGVFKVPDTNHVAEITHTFHLRSIDFIRTLIYSKTMSTSQADWDLATYNCVDVVLGAGTAAGLTLPDPLGKMPSWLGGGWFSNPGMFGDDLNQLP